MAITVIDNYEWEYIYRNVQDVAQIPGISNVMDSGSQFVFRDMLVELDDILNAVGRASSPPIMIFVYADVVRMPAERNWALKNMALFIAARRIEANNGTFFQLDYRKKDNAAKLTIYATEIEGPLKVKVFTTSESQQSPIIYDLSQFDSLGVQLSQQDGTAVKKELAYIGEEAFKFGGDLWMSLSCIFQFASVLFDSQPDVAGAMLNWIKSSTANSTIAREMYLQSSALLSQLTLSSSKVSFVPYLSYKVYQDIAKEFEDAAMGYDAQYQIFRQEKENKKCWIDSANQMEKYFKLTGNFQQQSIDQARENFDNAMQAVEAATNRLNWQQHAVDSAAITFRTGVEIWKEDQILKAVFSICTALIEFAGSIALMAFGDEAAGASAGKSVVEAGKAAKEAAAAGGKASKMAKTMKDLAEAMKNLQKIGKALIATYKFINKLVKASSDISAASKFDDMIISSEVDISCQAEWDIFKLNVGYLMKDVIDVGISGSREYNLELDKLVVYGKALSATQSSSIQSAQQLSQLYMQKQVSDGMKASLNEYIKKLEQDIKPDDVMMHLLYVRGINIKRWIYIAILNYIRAYRYWALRESMVKPSILKSVQELREDLAKIKQDYADALSTFSPPPQDFGLKGMGIPFEITDEKVLAEFKSYKEMHIILPLDARTFQGFDRVRLTLIRVWLYGIKSDEPIYLNISNSGTYYDRLKGKTYYFTSSPLDRRFVYEGEPGVKKGIRVDGSVADEEKYAYFQPTPFSEWLISLPEKYNPEIDLSNLSKVTMTFAGSVIGE